MKIVLTYAATWLGLMVLAILNGLVREKTYGPSMQERTAHQFSTLVLLVVIGGYVWLLTGIVPLESTSQSLLIGAMWLIMTLLFEFLFGHWVMGHPWEKLVQNYNLRRGRVWSLILIWTALAPYVFFRVRS